MTMQARHTEANGTRPTIVLVHGAFADGSSWDGVIERLQRQGYTAVAPAVGLRGVKVDSAYLASVVSQIDGPVLLVGHSYAGALIGNGETLAANVVGLVYVCAFAPDADERLGDVAAESNDSVLMTAQLQREYPTGPGGETSIEVVIDPTRFREVFAADLPPERTAVMAAAQRPVALAAFTDPCGPPAWKMLPSWAIVATADKAAGTDLVRSMARRAGAEIVEVDASHVVMVSQPQVVTDVIVRASEAAVAAGTR
jgi:pimeloyl-ACP methyl ester carboxylesterase